MRTRALIGVLYELSFGERRTCYPNLRRRCGHLAAAKSAGVWAKEPFGVPPAFRWKASVPAADLHRIDPLVARSRHSDLVESAVAAEGPVQTDSQIVLSWRRCNGATKGRFDCLSGQGLRRQPPTRRDPNGAIAPPKGRSYEDLLQALMPSNEKPAALQRVLSPILPQIWRLPSAHTGVAD